MEKACFIKLNNILIFPPASCFLQAHLEKSVEGGLCCPRNLDRVVSSFNISDKSRVRIDKWLFCELKRTQIKIFIEKEYKYDSFLAPKGA